MGEVGVGEVGVGEVGVGEGSAREVDLAKIRFQIWTCFAPLIPNANSFFENFNL